MPAGVSSRRKPAGAASPVAPGARGPAPRGSVRPVVRTGAARMGAQRGGGEWPRVRRRAEGVALPRLQIAGIQRSRLLAAAVQTMDELGYAEASVADIVSRARVSRRTFYELFANRDECLAGVLADTIARVELELELAGVARLAWRQRLHMGLWLILNFLEREQALARVCVVQALGGGPAVRAQREAILTRLTALVDMGRFESARGGECSQLTAEGLVGAACMIINARLARRETLLGGLPGELIGLILTPYLGPAAARREQTRATPAAPGGASCQHAVEPYRATGDLLQGVPMRLTYRTARVLDGVAENPGSSNRQIADYAGIADPGQVSKLLRRLERLGLLENHGGGHAQGEPNQWWLTNTGTLVTESIATHTTTNDGGSKRR